MAHWIKFVTLLASIGATFAVNPYIWHLTDLHIDPYYDLHYDLNSCNEQLQQPGYYGDYECDTPTTLHQSAVKAMVDWGREPLFIIYSGDSPGHLKDAGAMSTELVLSYLENVTQSFNSSFQTSKMVFALGNYDYYPVNQLPGETNPIYAAAAELWRPWFNNSQTIVDTFTKGAYYSQLVGAQLRVVVINTQLYAENNQATAGQTDPAGQFAWLTGVLASAATAGEKVHVVMHTPPGVRPSPLLPRWLRETHNTQLIDILTAYSDIIVGIYAGHEHFDSFRILYKDGIPVITMLVAPSVSPWRERETPEVTGMARNPGIRKIYFDEYEGHLADVEQIYLDLPRANEGQVADWLKLYKFTGLYQGVNNLTAPTLHALVQEFKLYANDDFHAYYDQFAVGARHLSNEPCSCECKYRHICSMERVRYSQFDTCFAGIICGAGTSLASVVLVTCMAVLGTIL